MGRRAKKAPVQTKKRQSLARRFKCPFCANENAVECKMDNRAGVGSLACRLCGASYQMPIHHLHEPVDVFSEWLDDCEAAERGGTTQPQTEQQQGPDESRGYFDGSDDEDDDLGAASGINNDNRKSSGNATTNNSSEKNSSPPQQQQPTYTSLGLDDSDDDSE
mmetsp:Transcript_16664/g.16094  ORF Transcript_16664/g.16094 Transcript_16664/m.16094 type:complete len:163 (-) Transcript_16664:593-1081(-)|eukprot:CAMPEP_0197832102 /NCGR_PEP_ID=MMETSP1437-20131217/13308_1 /TAXON_ID=49252 ORGANISM="Eucampia antarctica, Strain CCMP1452" /NCGR_SAMPLE_ID=MMETSP1437 /ASSEMBLY_ACC=CAM_ASM_001096 /LENGTH=162 /DNA_ID=CAMNT_0043435293 /DNA_START=23 /DNA_END=511 /DNA_ORIENTATION=+